MAIETAISLQGIFVSILHRRPDPQHQRLLQGFNPPTHVPPIDHPVQYNNKQLHKLKQNPANDLNRNEPVQLHIGQDSQHVAEYPEVAVLWGCALLGGVGGGVYCQ